MRLRLLILLKAAFVRDGTQWDRLDTFLTNSSTSSGLFTIVLCLLVLLFCCRWSYSYVISDVVFGLIILIVDEGKVALEERLAVNAKCDVCVSDINTAAAYNFNGHDLLCEKCYCHVFVISNLESVFIYQCRI